MQLTFGSHASTPAPDRHYADAQDDEVVKPESEKIKYTSVFMMKIKPMFLKAPDVLVKNFPELIPPQDADAIVNISAAPVPAAAKDTEDKRDWRSRASGPSSYVSANDGGVANAKAAAGNPEKDRQWGHKGFEEAKVMDEIKRRQQVEKPDAPGAPSADRSTWASGNKAPDVRPPESSTASSNSGVVANKMVLPEMKKTKNAWRPGSQVDAKTKLIRSVRDVLNKLTPEKFDKLVNQMLDLGINSPETLHICIVQVFEKAVAEPHFTELYADLCAALSNRLPEFTSTSNDGKPVTFRRVLLNTCQEEFEGTNAARERLSSSQMSPEERATEEDNIKKRTLGNIRLIGELYKKQMVQEKIVHVCITDLLQVKRGDEFPSEESIEALCHLLATVGKQVDTAPRSKTLMDSYMKRLYMLSKNDKLHSRLRFMCRDAVDLRENDWVPRRKKEKAKKLKEIHNEAEKAMGIQKGLIANKLHTQSDEAELFPTLMGNADGWVEVGKKGKATANPDNIVAGNYSALVGTAPALPVASPAVAGTAESEASAAAVAAKPKVLKLTDEQRDKKADSMIKEFMSSGDVGEAMYCVEELGGADKYGSKLATTVVRQLVEALERDAKMLNKLITGLGVKGGLTKDQIVSAIHQQTSQLDDLAIDVPLAPKNIGDLLAACALSTVDNNGGFGFSLNELTGLLSSVEDARHKRACFACICKAIKDAKSEADMVKLVKDSGLNVEVLLQGDPQFDESVADFLKSQSLAGLI